MFPLTLLFDKDKNKLKKPAGMLCIVWLNIVGFFIIIIIII